tara:strand:- start:2124 stop:2537 length:414 start_codon:yes stop_codon:yes gene_type:complete
MTINTSTWGPSFWKTLHIICHHYPIQPNSVMKKKIYDFFHNLPVFIPDHEIGDKFSEILDQYPMKPYLDSRDALCKWIHFIHNRINIQLNKPQLSYKDYIKLYTYTPEKSNTINYFNYTGFIVIIILLIIIFSKNNI